MINLPRNPIADAIRDYPAVHTLKTIRISTVEAGQPFSLILGWWIRSFRDPDADKKLPGVKVSGWVKPADTHILIRSKNDLDKVASLLDVETWIATTAWRLGGGYLHRWWREPIDYARRNDPAMGVTNDFGVNDYIIDGEPLVKGDPMRQAMVDQASRQGYWSWEANVTYGTERDNLYFSRWRENDASLQSDGSRTIKMPEWRDAHIPFDDSIRNCRRISAGGDEVQYNLVKIAGRVKAVER